MNNKRRSFLFIGGAVLLTLCCVGMLGVRLFANVFPVSLSTLKFNLGQPLGDGEALAFSLMRLEMLRPFEIYLVDDASGVHSLSEGWRRSDTGPIWSPDGSQILYQSVSGWSTRYFVVSPDGSERREIGEDTSHKALPRWSPDGSHLAYLKYEITSEGAPSDSPLLCIANLKSGETFQIQARNVRDMAWMPDGEQLIAVVRAGEKVTIGFYDTQGHPLQGVMQADFLQGAVYIAISPDVNKVAYVRLDEDIEAESWIDTLHIAALDGSSNRSVEVRWAEGAIAWSPDSSKIAFIAFTGDYEYALHVVEADGSSLKELMVVNDGDESGEILPANPAWSPDGSHIAISSVYSPNSVALFVMNADGTRQRQVITMEGFTGMIYDLVWRP